MMHFQRSIAFAAILSCSQALAKSPAILSVAGVVNDVIHEEGMEREYSHGAGVLLESELNPYFGFETGLLAMERSYSIHNIEAKARKLHIPLLARLWPSRFISLGLGPYAALKIGDSETRVSGQPSEAFAKATTADETAEVGFEAAVAVNVSFGSKSGVFVEARASHFFFRKTDETPDFFSALLGLKFHL